MKNLPALISTDELKTIQTLAETFHQAGIFPDTKSVAQGVTKILAGRELGIGAFESMRGIDIIKGKTAMNSGLISARIKSNSKYDFIVTRLDDDGCSIQFLQNGEKIGESSFTKSDAAKAQISSHMYGKYPRNMFFARALTNGARWYCSDVFGGAVYTPDELIVEQAEAEVLEVVEAPRIEAKAIETKAIEVSKDPWSYIVQGGKSGGSMLSEFDPEQIQAALNSKRVRATLTLSDIANMQAALDNIGDSILPAKQEILEVPLEDDDIPDFFAEENAKEAA